MSLKVNFFSAFFLIFLALQSIGSLRRYRHRNARRWDNGLELLHVNLVWRHGARSPIRHFPSNPNSNYKWNQEEDGQLTQVGMRQQYELGRFLRFRYGDFLSRAYKSKEIYIRSTDADRTLMSAQCNMAGLYTPRWGQIWKKGMRWQPIPVHTIDIDDDKLLFLPVSRKLVNLLLQVQKSPEYQRVELENQGFLAELTRFTQSSKNLTLYDTWDIHDPLICAETEGLDLPEWYTSDRSAKLLKLASFLHGRFFGKDTPLQDAVLKMNRGFLVKEMFQNFDNSINQTVSYKTFAYSGHDLTLTGLLVALGNYQELSPFASCLMVELYKDSSAVGEKQYIVRTFYRTTPHKRPQQLNVLGCGMNCPLAKLKRLSASFIPDDE